MQEYHHNNIHLYRRDCMEALAEMPDNAFDFAIVDPPYGVGDTFRFGSSGAIKGKLNRIHNPMDWDNEIPPKKYFIELQRVSKNQIIWGANYFNCFTNDGGALIWYKNRGGNTMSQCEVASVSNQKKVDYVAIQILTGFCAKEERIHPTQKPIALYEWLLTNYAKPNQKILDTHLGSGSIAIACEKMGYSLTGFEIDQEYFDGAVDRFKKHLKQPRLDFSTPTPLPEQLTIPDE